MSSSYPTLVDLLRHPLQPLPENACGSQTATTAGLPIAWDHYSEHDRKARRLIVDNDLFSRHATRFRQYAMVHDFSIPQETARLYAWITGPWNSDMRLYLQLMVRGPWHEGEVRQFCQETIYRVIRYIFEHICESVPSLMDSQATIGFALAKQNRAGGFADNIFELRAPVVGGPSLPGIVPEMVYHSLCWVDEKNFTVLENPEVRATIQRQDLIPWCKGDISRTSELSEDAKLILKVLI